MPKYLNVIISVRYNKRAYENKKPVPYSEQRIIPACQVFDYRRWRASACETCQTSDSPEISERNKPLLRNACQGQAQQRHLSRRSRLYEDAVCHTIFVLTEQFSTPKSFWCSSLWLWSETNFSSLGWKSHIRREAHAHRMVIFFWLEYTSWGGHKF